MNIETIKNLLSINELQAQLVAAAGVLLLSFILYLITKNILLKVILKLSKKTKTLWDDKLMERKVFDKLNYIIPVLIIYFSASLFPIFKVMIERSTKTLIVWFTVMAASSFLSAVNDIYLT